MTSKTLLSLGAFMAVLVLVSAPASAQAAPNTTITTPGQTVTGASAAWAFAASETATFVCSLDGATPTACTSPVTYTGLAQGLHVVEVTATDSAGNSDESPAYRFWQVDV